MDERRYREVEERLWKSIGAAPTEAMLDVELDSVASVRVQEVGHGPPILMIHGGAVCGASWAPLAAALPDFRCIILDRPGSGLSSAVDRSFDSVDEFAGFAAKVLPAVLNAMNLDRADVLCTSLGGFYGFHGAAAYPERVNHLVGIGSIFGSPMDHIPLIMRLGAIGPMPRLMARMPPSRQAVRAMLRQIGLKDALKAGRVTREFEDWFLASLKYTDSVVSDTTVTPQIMDMKGMRPEVIFTDDMLRQITVPTKLIWGERDPMAGADVATAFTAKLPNAELELWPNTGHAPWIDDPTRAADSIREFLS